MYGNSGKQRAKMGGHWGYSEGRLKIIDRFRDWKIVFLHIPKVGGTTLKVILSKFYSLEDIVYFDCFSPKLYDFTKSLLKSFKNKKLIMGHFPLLVDPSSLKDAKFITFLREPVKRSLSGYCASLVSQGVDVAPPKDVRENPELWPDNIQTRLLCGKLEGTLSEADLERAKRNLSQFFFVGLTERFDESLLILQKLLNFEEVFYGIRRNVTRATISVGELSKRVLRQVEDVNGFDIELYKFGCKLFEERSKEYGKRLLAELDEFRKNNQGVIGWLALTYLDLLDHVRYARVSFMFRLAKRFAEDGKKEEALAFLRKGICLSWGIHANAPLFLYNEASVWKSLGELEKAEGIFKIVADHPLRMNALKGGAYYYLGCIALEKGDIAVARENLQKCLSFVPDHKEAKKLLSKLRGGLGK